ncbi:hypothetical protein EON63_25165 [archaeon]|nr:MAG: hypothetical protein EON63_25165 [archaeon]
MIQAASQRSIGRLPALVWLHPETKAPLCRAAQPMAGMTLYLDMVMGMGMGMGMLYITVHVHVDKGGFIYFCLRVLAYTLMQHFHPFPPNSLSSPPP